MITILNLRSLFADLAPSGMGQVFADWEMMAGLEAKAKCGDVAVSESVADLSTRVSTRHVVVETKVERSGDAIGAIYFVFPIEVVVEVVGELLMISEDVREEKIASGLSNNDIEAFKEMANLLCGSWNRIFQERDKSFRVSQSVEDLELWCGAQGDEPFGPDAMVAALAEDRYVHVPVEIEIGASSFTSLIAMPFSISIALANEWFSVMDPRAA